MQRTGARASAPAPLSRPPLPLGEGPGVRVAQRR